MPKKRKILPVLLHRSLFDIKIKKRPKPSAIGEYLPTSMAIIWLLMVVPILAPITMPIACLKFIIPELTNMIVMIITAEDESRIAVIMVPVTIAVNRLPVNLTNHSFDFSAAKDFSKSERLITAKRKSTSPPTIERIVSRYISRKSTNVVIKTFAKG